MIKHSQLFVRMMILTVYLLTLTITRVDAQGAETLDTETIDALVSSMMADYDVPGFSLAIVKDGEVIYAQGYGVRNIETGEPITPDTQFHVGSVSKSFTSLAIAQQVDAGTLDLDTPIVTYLPDFTLTDTEAAQNLTLRHLLSNAAGFQPDDIPWYAGKVQTMAEVVAHIQTLPVHAQPGTTYVYNNLGYTLAGYVLEQVTGIPYAEYLDANIFEPLDMKEATADFAAMQQTENHITPHLLDAREGVKPIAFFDNMDAIAPAGAVSASALEMANYAIFQLGDGTFNGEAIVSETMLTETHTAQIADYALGWVVGEQAGYQTVWHNGSMDGFGALVGLVPAENLGVVGLMNADYIDNGGFLDALVLRVVEITLGVEPETDTIAAITTGSGLDPVARKARFEAARSFEADPTTYAPYVGDYISMFGDISVELREDQSLWFILTTQGIEQAFELVEFEPGKFIANGHGLFNSVFEFQLGRQDTLRLVQDGISVAEKQK